ncbi:MAG: hypothetical protein ACI8QC_002292 [Planctomycetota bacterium]|jgi:hypothetical protein
MHKIALPLLLLATAPVFAQGFTSTSGSNRGNPTYRPRGLNLWLRADRSARTGLSNLTHTWRDRSGEGNHVTQELGNRRPELIEQAIGGQPALRFDGGDTLFAPEGMPLGSYTKVVVFSIEDFSRNNHLVAGTNDHSLWFATSDHARLFHSGTFAVSSQPVGLGEPTLLVATYDAGTGQGYLYQDGVLVGGGHAAPNTDISLRIGGYSGGGYLAGLIAEVMVIDHVLTPAERSSVEGLMNERYFQNNPPEVTFTHLPQHGRVFQRNAQDQHVLQVAGTINSPGFTDVEIELRRDHQLLQTLTQPLLYSGRNAAFSIAPTIQAGLFDYHLEIYARFGSQRIRIQSRHNLTCGDLLMVVGQSNAVGGDFNGEGLGNNAQTRWVRAYGTPNVDPDYERLDRHWDKAEGEIWSAHASIGQWALDMGARLVTDYQVPIGILSGAANGTQISAHQRNDLDPTDENSIYGRMLKRAELAGFKDQAKGLIWYQGEEDGGNPLNYALFFNELYDDWFTDYTALEQLYVCQIRAGCGNDPINDGIREVLRVLPDLYANLEVMSTTAALGHDGCHFLYEGYTEIGERMTRVIKRDLYGSMDTHEIDPPNIDTVQWGSMAQDLLVLTFRDLDDSLTFELGAELDFVLSDGTVVTAGTVTGNSILLTLAGPSTATDLSYIGHAFDGPDIKNGRGVGALTFFNQQILP